MAKKGRGRVSKPIKRRSSWVWCNCCTSNHSGRALSTQRDSFCRVPTILYLGFFGWSLVHVALLESSHWSLTTVRSGGAYVKGTIIVADPREGSGHLPIVLVKVAYYASGSARFLPKLCSNYARFSKLCYFFKKLFYAQTSQLTRQVWKCILLTLARRSGPGCSKPG